MLRVPARFSPVVVLASALLLPSALQAGERIQVTFKSGTAHEYLEKAIGLPTPIPDDDPDWDMYSTHIVGSTRIKYYEIPWEMLSFWLTTLGDMPAIESVVFDYPVQASLKRDTFISGAQAVISDSSDFDPGPPVRTLTVAQAAPGEARPRVGKDQRTINDQVLDFVKAYYGNTATIKTLKDEENCLSLVVEHIRGRIVEKPAFWERAELYFVFIPKTTGVSIHFVLDGYYAPGIGPVPPSADIYQDMQQKYYGELARYADQFTTALKKRLESLT